MTTEEQNEVIKVPAEHRQKLIAQVLKGEIKVGDFPPEVFSERMEIVVRYPPSFDYSKLSDSALKEIAECNPDFILI